MVDVWGDVLRPPHGTTPAAVKSNRKSTSKSMLHCKHIEHTVTNMNLKHTDIKI